MTASDKKKTVVLVLLLAGAGLSWYYVYRPTTGAAADVAAKAPPKTKPVKIGQDAAIRIDMVPNTSAVSIGQINLFDYRQKPVPKPTEQVRPVIQQPNFQSIAQSNPPPPIQPAPQPWKAFRYEGFSVSKNGGKILASITEGGVTYEVREGGCFGQYCVTRLTESLVELEDILLMRKQTFTRTQVQ
jgi:hypothetical protein